MGRSAQQMKHENAQKHFAQFFAQFFAQTSARVIKMCRRNFALGNVRRNRPGCLQLLRGNVLFGGVPTTLDPNISAKVSRYKWEAYHDTNWWCIYYFLPRGQHTFAKICDRNGRCIAIIFQSIGVRGRFDSPDLLRSIADMRLRSMRSFALFCAHLRVSVSDRV